ncbi:MAG: hypothetical protein HY878_00155, partial [Deltaproteobacteria bacterium]|nr:hypothetical protein [Deltaproteobacteria bacterium]
MKRLGILVFVALVVAAWSIPAYAVDTSFNVQYRIRAFALENANDFDNANGTDQDNWIDQRFRLGITIKEAPVTGYVQMQLGGHAPNFSTAWGQGLVEGTWTFNSSEETFLLRQAYLDFPVGPFGVRLGRTYASHGFLAGGMFENIADRIIISYKQSPELTWSFIHAKAREGSYVANTGISMTAGTNDADRNIYNLGFVWKPSGQPYDLSARVYYVRDGDRAYTASGGTGAGTGTFDAWWFTAQTNIKFEPANLYLSAAILDGKSKPLGAAELDVTGYAVHADLNVVQGPFKAGIRGGIGSGDESTTDTDLETFFAPGLASYAIGKSHIYWQSGENNYSQFFLNTGNLNLQNGSLQTLSNTTWAGVYVSFKATDNLTLGGAANAFYKTEELAGTDDK